MPDLSELRCEILNYAHEPYRYPKRVTEILLAAVNELQLDEEGETEALATPITLLSSLMCTLRAYDSDRDEGLESELLGWWPRAMDAVARLPAPTAEALQRLGRTRRFVSPLPYPAPSSEEYRVRWSRPPWWTKLLAATNQHPKTLAAAQP